jgi:histidinol-phosphate aminotransferase
MLLRTKIQTDSLPRYLGNDTDDFATAVDLATNENRLGPSPLALQAYAEASADLFRYPDSAHRRLKSALSERFSVAAGKIACGAGSDELISMLARLFAGPGDEVLYPEFSFIMFLRYALRVGATPMPAPTSGYRLFVDGILERLSARTSIVFVANPNNPTGSYLNKSEIRRLASSIPRHIPLVLDCAYADYADDPDYSDGLDLIEEFENVIVLRTFSKLYALASLRIGWCFAASSLVDKLDRLRGPYNLSGAAQAAAVQAILDHDHQQVSLQHNSLWRTRLTQELSQLGLDVEPSAGNFITVIFGSSQTADNAYRFLLGRGLLTRPLHDYAMPECIRITVGRADDNERVMEAFHDYRELHRI